MALILILSLCSCGKRDTVITVSDDPVTLPTSETAAETNGDSGGSDGDITIIMAGDMLLHDPVIESGEREDGTLNYDHIFAHTKDIISGADLAICNQEVILGGKELGLSGYPQFNGPFEFGDSLAKAGFDVILHSSNHTFDRGKKAILNCLDFWETEHPEITVCGLYSDKSGSDDICYREVGGYRIAVLNYTYTINSGVRDEYEADPYMVRILDEDTIAADAEKARSEGADLIVACPHWGVEDSLSVSDDQRYWADVFAENEVDVIFGAHPHVVEPVGTVTSPAGKEIPVYYSVGNFVNATAGEGRGVAARVVGLIAKVVVTAGKDGGLKVSEYTYEPIVTHIGEGEAGITVYPLDDYTEDLAEENGIIERDDSFSLDYCRELVEELKVNN